MKNQEQISIEEKELPELKKFLKSKNKKISKIIKLNKNSLRVFVGD
ncbi:MAG: hypothetical protein ABH811_01590 [archaeon]